MAEAASFLITAKQLNGDIIEVELSDPTVENFKKAVADDIKVNPNTMLLMDPEQDGKEIFGEYELTPGVMYMLFISPTVDIENRVNELQCHLKNSATFKTLHKMFEYNPRNPELIPFIEDLEFEMQRTHRHIAFMIQCEREPEFICPCIKKHIAEDYLKYVDLATAERNSVTKRVSDATRDKIEYLERLYALRETPRR